ncbi:MAG: imidazole glycerol phosphate synthase subunit HisH [bacterium]
MIVIIDYSMGNSGSILNMLKKIGANAISSSKMPDIEKADKLILPGVGAFDNGMTNLNKSGLIPILNEIIFNKKIPILGICLGMQLLAKRSEEGTLSGLGWLDAEVVRFKFDTSCNLKIPHMGWDTVELVKENCMFKGLEQSRFYFVHSYHVVCHNRLDILAETCYGYNFVSAVQKDNIIGVQFHPEKSHKFGMTLLRNFVEL